MLSLLWIMVFLHLRVGQSLYVILKRVSRGLEGLQRVLPPCKGDYFEHAHTSRPTFVSSKGKPLGSHMVGWKYPFHPVTPLWLGGPHGVECIGNQVIRRSPILWAHVKAAMFQNEFVSFYCVYIFGSLRKWNTLVQNSIWLVVNEEKELHDESCWTRFANSLVKAWWSQGYWPRSILFGCALFFPCPSVMLFWIILFQHRVHVFHLETHLGKCSTSPSALKALLRWRILGNLNKMMS